MTKVARRGEKRPEVGSPEWFAVMGGIEEGLNTYVVEHGMPEVPSPNAALRDRLAGAVIWHAAMRAVDEPHIDEWRTAARDLANLARAALKVSVVDVPFLFPGVMAPLHLTVFRGILPGKMATVVDGRGWYRFERADLEVLATRASVFAGRLRGRRRNLALRILRKSVSEAIEVCCGPGSAKCYMDNIADGPSGLLYTVLKKLQPWLVGLEKLSDRALCERVVRVSPHARRRCVTTRKSRRRVK
jgi:hypothetical protein